MSSGSQFDEKAVCDVCGRFGAFDFGGEHLCVDCYEGRGSCCAEFAGHDLCEADEQPAQDEKKPASQPEKR